MIFGWTANGQKRALRLVLRSEYLHGVPLADARAREKDVAG